MRREHIISYCCGHGNLTKKNAVANQVYSCEEEIGRSNTIYVRENERRVQWSSKSSAAGRGVVIAISDVVI
jgi:hypothetical protein